MRLDSLRCATFDVTRSSKSQSIIRHHASVDGVCVVLLHVYVVSLLSVVSRMSRHRRHRRHRRLQLNRLIDCKMRRELSDRCNHDGRTDDISGTHQARGRPREEERKHDTRGLSQAPSCRWMRLVHSYHSSSKFLLGGDSQCRSLLVPMHARRVAGMYLLTCDGCSVLVRIAQLSLT